MGLFLHADFIQTVKIVEKFVEKNNGFINFNPLDIHMYDVVTCWNCLYEAILTCTNSIYY